MRYAFLVIPVLFASTAPILGADLQVPQDYATIQAAIDRAKSGDTVLVSAGTYQERIELKPGIAVRSAGNDTKGKVGLRRAEATILDGGAGVGEKPGVIMATGSTLDGFTITRVGVYDEAIWNKHYDSKGEELGDDEGAVRAEGGTPAVSASTDCTITNNIVKYNGDVGIAVTGSLTRRVAPLVANNFCFRNLGGGIGIADHATPTVRNNNCVENLRAGIGCRNANPLILGNVCLGNIRAGIGCRERARPIIQDNDCSRNRRAGIGIRMKGTAPIVEGNRCHENEMAGIGNRDGAEPIIRGNHCFKNKMAGIGSDGSSPAIIDNVCRANLMAGIGLRGKAKATIQDNVCSDNRLVAIGVTQGSVATIIGNELARTGNAPPIIAIKDDSRALIFDNDIEGGGVAAVLVNGTATIRGNRFQGKGKSQGNSVWVWKGSKATVSNNTFRGYRAAISATEAEVVATNNTIRGFQGPAIIVKQPSKPAHIHGNRAISGDPKAVVIEFDGQEGVVADNVVVSPRD